MTTDKIDYRFQARRPTQQELATFLQFTLLERRGEHYTDKDEREIRFIVKDAHIVVFDNYQPDGIAHVPVAGKLMLVIWGTSADEYEMYTWSEESGFGTDFIAIPQNPSLFPSPKGKK
jgi:hypothetical protein